MFSTIDPFPHNPSLNYILTSAKHLLNQLASPSLGTGCSLNIVFFSKILKYSRLWPFSVFPRCQCVYTHQAGKTPAL